jgi:hypothetical protein
MKKILAAMAGLALAGSAANAAFITINLNQVFSVDELGDVDNIVGSFATGFANGQVVGIGWDVSIFADSPSYLSEAAVAFGSTTNFNAINYPLTLTPGNGDDFPGTQTYSSAGVIDLVGLGFDFALDADGLLWLEFFEGFDDFANDWDGIWNGTLTIEVIPTPSSFALLGFAGLVAGRRRR